MTTLSLSTPGTLPTVKRIGTSLAFILFPLLFVFAFAVHPGLLNPHKLTELELIFRQRHNALLAIGHSLVLLDAAIGIVVTLELMRRLDRSSGAWLGFIGAGATVLGAVALGAEKGAECLTMSALESLTDSEFSQMIPGLLAIFSHQGLMILVMGVLLLAVGFSLQAIGLLITNRIPRWQSALLLIGFWLLGWPDGEEIVALFGSLLLTAALIPYGIHLLTSRPAADQSGESIAAQVGTLQPYSVVVK